MAVVNWSAEAEQDLANIIAYYEDRSPAYAEALVQQLFEAISRLERFPQLGRYVPELSLEPFREILVAGYRIVYLYTEREEGNEEVDLLVIAHSRQDLIKKLSRRE
ncbi:MAG: type II toxin-antitoxin system RelE/ParE family toxin [Bacteroidetes bacterium]|jgi:plasmid stabilization system protein ParE|nr:type II toxin-antitoxin system RelE/ParE family toxin [Bacteroidota bacterium]